MRRTSGSAAVVIAALSIVTLCTAAPGHSQSVEGGRAGPRDPMDRDQEIRLALSAAPPAVTESATVVVWAGGGFETARRGSNGVTCYVARSWPESLEPHCFDPEGSRTILPIHMRQMELWHAGRTGSEIEAAIGEGLRTGKFRLPSRPVMSYMMSAGQHLINDEGAAAGQWESHLMIYYPYLTESDLGLGAVPSTEAAIVVDPGTPLSHILIVLKSFVEVAQLPTDGGRGWP